MFENILVTGGAGFAGSAISLTLKRVMPDARVCALDNLRRRGSELNLERLRAGRVDFVHGDVRSLEDFIDLGHSPDLIIECSAEASRSGRLSGRFRISRAHESPGRVSLSRTRSPVKGGDPLRFHQPRVSVYAAEMICITRRTIRDSPCPRPSLFPARRKKGISEAFPLSGPRSLYGMTKLAAELMVEEYGNAFGLPYIINRCGLLTGPWQMARSDRGVIALWLAAHYFRRPLLYIGFGATGKQVRDFLHIEDFCDLIVDQVRNFSR